VSIALGWLGKGLETQIVHQETGVEQDTAKSLVKAVNKITMSDINHRVHGERGGCRFRGLGV